LKLGFKHSIVCNGTKCIIYQRGFSVLIDEETLIIKKEYLTKMHNIIDPYWNI
jgi:hypothetical protein